MSSAAVLGAYSGQQQVESFQDWCKNEANTCEINDALVDSVMLTNIMETTIAGFVVACGLTVLKNVRSS